MTRSFSIWIVIWIVVLAAVQSTTGQSEGARLIDSFGRLPCGHMMARLDVILTEWSKSPENTIVVVYTSERYGKNSVPQRDGTVLKELRLVHRDDGLNWAKGIPKYLLERYAQGEGANKIKILGDRITLIDGGYDEETRADIWFVPPGSSSPTPVRKLKEEQITFRLKPRQRIPDYANCYSMYN